MREIVGITHSGVVPGEYASGILKRLALTFDRIGFVDYGSDYFRLDENEELIWLLDKGVIFKAEPEPTSVIAELKDDDDLREYFASVFKSMEQAMTPLFAAYSGETIHANTLSSSWTEAINQFMSHTSRWLSVHLRKTSQAIVYPILNEIEPPDQITEADKAYVMRVIINSLPVPDELTSWEQILEFRNDPETMGKFLALRNWVNEVARAKLSPVEVEEKLEWLIYDYQRHLELNKLKNNVGTLEIVVVTGAEIIENLLKVNWGKAAKALFSLKQRRIALLEGEINSPGNEIAYILKAREMIFESSKS